MVQTNLNQLCARKLSIRGIVQGVGFRPFVYTQALNNHLSGWVRNTSAGVEIHVEGASSSVDQFIGSFISNLPPLARIDKFEISDTPVESFSSFQIISSESSDFDFIPISPDVTICKDCIKELFDPTNRRYRYPFINCTNCGPRFSIINNIPYDRPYTTMADFEMCPDCRAEYENPLDRRFHAQPIACPVCGPHVELFMNSCTPMKGDEALLTARQKITEGRILAVKGLGGVHLVCDASNPEAVKQLRDRKKRSDKAFALMAFDLQAIRKYCSISPQEAELLQSPQHPIVLLDQICSENLAREIAPNQKTCGFMLPYTPLHYLLLEPGENYPEVLVMTSGNLSDEPITYKDEDIITRLSGLADGFLLHNRRIHTRVDDSVTRVIAGSTNIIRRGRGYVPNTIHLPHPCKNILGTGGELKNTFCLTRDEYGFLSHHIGDMENYDTYTAFEEGISHFEKIFRIKPDLLACDLHPDYLSTKYAINRCEEQNIPLIQVQHHHAHLAACLADNGWDTDEPVIGLCFDGTGYGPDQAIWGGEVLLGGYKSYARKFHLAYMPLPGGEVSIHKTARIGLSYLYSMGIPWENDLPSVNALSSVEKKSIQALINHNINSPFTSSVGRLFDAVASLIGIRQDANYEGQAAIELENLADPDETGFYKIDLNGSAIPLDSLLINILHDYRDKVPVPIISARFHNSLVELCFDVCQDIHHSSGSNTVALSGGVWQNCFLLQRVIQKLKGDKFTVLIPHQVPCNDGGISLGQVMVAGSII